MEILFQNRTTNGEGTAADTIRMADEDYIKRTLHLSGNLDGGTFELMLYDGIQYNVVPDSAITSVPTIANFEFRADSVKGKLSGCGAGCNITAILK